jgi:TonB family protein
VFDKTASTQAASRSALLISLSVHAVLVVIFWTTPHVLRKQFVGIQIVHAGTVETLVSPVGVALRPASRSDVRPESRTPIPPVPSESAHRVSFEESKAAEKAIPDDFRGSSDVGPAFEISEQQLGTRLKDLPRMNVEPTSVAAPLAPEHERNLETSDFPPIPKGRKVEPARLLKQVLPVYPSLARTARIQGSVILEASIGQSGKIEDVMVIEGHPMLITAAIDAVRQWQYEPAKLDEVPTRSSVRVTVVFRLEFPR